MALSNPRIMFGVHSIAPYNRTTGEYYGIAKVIGSAEFALSGSLIELFGGSSKYSWSVQEGVTATDIALNLKEYPSWLFQVMLGKAATENAAESGASVTALANKYGSSLFSATTGIASVTVLSGSEADVKFSSYVAKVVSATTVDVYASSDVDFLRGTDLNFENDLLKITASPLTITASAATNIPGTGLKFTGGSGTIGMTIGDTAVFSSRPINTKSLDVVVGGPGEVSPEFGLYMVGEKLGSGHMVELDIFRCKASGLPFPFAEKAFSEPAFSVKAFQDTARGGVFKLRHVEPTNFV
jgi:hypothetical protein